MGGRLVVAGGSGFLGRYFLADYSKEFDELLVLSRSAHPDQGSCRFRKTDYSQEELDPLLEGADSLLILAGQRGKSPLLSYYFPSIQLFENLCLSAGRQGVGKVVFASSISVYGRDNALPWEEKDFPHPDSSYGLYKLSCEERGRQLGRQYGFVFTSLRLAHLYGANEKNNYMINLFMRRAWHGEALILNQRPEGRRDFLYARDAASALFLAIDRGAGGSYNITATDVLTNGELAEAINRAFENPEPIQLLDPEQGDGLPDSWQSGRKAEEVLGFKANYRVAGAMKEIRKEMGKADDIPIYY